MNNNEKIILEKINHKHNGTYFTIRYTSDVETSAKFKGIHKVTKTSTFSIRKGVEYHNTKKYIAKQQSSVELAEGYNGNHNVPERKSFYHHVTKALMKHNDKDSYYILAYPNPLTIPRTQYYVDGNPVTKTELLNSGIMKPSFGNSKEKEVMLLKLENIEEVF